MRAILIIVIAFLLSKTIYAQQQALYGQYLFNNAIINPSSAGIKSENQVGVLYRKQWVGIEGAPETKSLFLNMRTSKNTGFAFGAYQDEIGPLKNTNVQIDFSSRVDITESWKLSGGIRVTASTITASLNSLALENNTDPNFSQNLSSNIFMNVGTGLTVYNEKTFIGISTPQVFNQEIKNGSDFIITNQRHYFLYGGSSFKINESFSFSPSMLAKYANNAPLQIDLNAVFNYKSVLDFGLMTRSTDALGFLLGLKVNKNWYFGYMYDYPTTSLRLVTQQSHEISLRFIWDTKIKSRINSPRYFL